jgi:glutathione S-transferase
MRSSFAREELAPPTLIGRSSSHFTRVTRIFAAERGVDYDFQVVRDLMSLETEDYGGNPALKLPTLKSSRGIWFGALNICREFARHSALTPRIVWPEHLDQPLLGNAQELVLHAMATEVSLLMDQLSKPGEDTPHRVKSRKSLLSTLSWLETNATRAIAALPATRDLSYLEVTLFCLVTHLKFRDVLPLHPYPNLSEYCQHFALRPSTDQTTYRYDS